MGFLKRLLNPDPPVVIDRDLETRLEGISFNLENSNREVKDIIKQVRRGLVVRTEELEDDRATRADERRADTNPGHAV